MITPADEDYKDTKRVKLGGAPLLPMFKVLAEWIFEQYDVLALNIILDTIEPNNLPRLNVVLEYRQDERKFRASSSVGFHVGFDVTKQREIRNKFASIAGDSSNHKSDLARLLVIFSSFEPVARQEANLRVADNDIERLEKTLGCPDLWKVRRGFGDATFFFYTEAQAKANAVSGARDRFAKAYASLTAPYDEFGYLSKRAIAARLDSKENFDSTYKGNWFNYDKGH